MTALTAVRFAEGFDNVVEGLAIPFGGPFRGGVDIYRTRFDHADLCLDWFRERPVLFAHGQDAEVGASVIGTVRTEDISDYDDGTRKGKWIKAQLDQRHEYFDAIKDLVTRGALGWSHGALSYLIEADAPARDGTRNITRWPVAEFTLTPVEANPDAFAVAHALRSADVPTVLRILGTSEDKLRVAAVRADGDGKVNKIHIGLSAKVKAKFLADLKDDPPTDMAQAMRRLSQWAASGSYPRGLNYDDLKWMYGQYALELHRRNPKSTAGGSFPAEGSGRSADIEPLRCASLTAALGAVAAEHDAAVAAAKAGRSSPGGLAVVGERGPEIVRIAPFRSSASDDAAQGAYVLGQMIQTLGDEADEPEQAAMIRDAIASWSKWIDAEQAEIGTPEDQADAMSPFMSFRAGARNSAADMAHINAIHDHSVALGATAHVGDTPHVNGEAANGGDDEDGANGSQGTDESDAARSGDARPVLRLVRQPVKVDLDALRAEASMRAATSTTAAEKVIADLLGH